MNNRFVLITAAALLATTAFGQAAGPRGGAAGGGIGQAQRGKGQGPGMGNIEKGVIAQLGLDKGQTAKVTALQKQRNDKIKAMIEKMQKGGTKTPDRQAFRGEFQKIQTWYQAELKSIIGAQKFAKYEALVKAEREKLAKQRGAGGKGGKG